MNILFSSDDNYVPYLGAAMYSLLFHNRQTECVKIYVVDNHISEENRKKLKIVAASFCNAELHFLSFDNWAPLLQLKMAWPISMSAYARLFAAEMLPQDMDRVLYMDCDMIVNADLSELWHYDLQGNCLGAVQDQVTSSIKRAVGVDPEISYFNSGLLLIDLNLWRQKRCGELCLHFIEQHEGRVIHHDQGVLNGVFVSQWTRLPLKYNVMTIHYFFNQYKMRKYFKDLAPFYEDEVIEIAKNTPSILHFTPSFTSHPWEKGCKHPMRKYYFDYALKTPWNVYPLKNDGHPFYVKIINWRYRTLWF